MAQSAFHRLSGQFRFVLFFVAIALGASNCSSETPVAADPAPTPAVYRGLAAQVEAALIKHDVDAWFPRCLDKEKGGFLSNFDREWNPGGDQPKLLVFQARMTWVASQYVLHRPELAERFRPIARMGAEYLTHQMWDAKEGGLYWQLTSNDQAPEGESVEKHAYSISFAIYALAAAGEALHEKTYIDRASEAFLWLDDHGHDAEHGGYYESFYRDGRKMLAAPPDMPGRNGDNLDSPWGCRSMDCHIHLLESFTALYRVWPDSRLRARLEELVHVLNDKIYIAQGSQNRVFNADWTPVSGDYSYGHDVEVAYLLTEAAAVLGQPDDSKIWQHARALVDHALAEGFDTEHGGFDDRGYPGSGPRDTGFKIWWVQTEGLNALLLMHQRYGAETDVYWRRFLQQWNFVQRYFDPVYGGWFFGLNNEGGVMASGKGTPWKAAYHTSRAMMNVTERLNGLAAHPFAGASSSAK